MNQRFELSDGKSHKFWEIQVSGSSHTLRYGRIGSDGQTKTKDFDSPAAAKAAAEKLIAKKTAKGYASAKGASKKKTSKKAPAKKKTSKKAPAKKKTSKKAPAKRKASKKAPAKKKASKKAPAKKKTSKKAPAKKEASKKAPAKKKTSKEARWSPQSLVEPAAGREASLARHGGDQSVWAAFFDEGVAAVWRFADSEWSLVVSGSAIGLPPKVEIDSLESGWLYYDSKAKRIGLVVSSYGDPHVHLLWGGERFELASRPPSGDEVAYAYDPRRGVLVQTDQMGKTREFQDRTWREVESRPTPDYDYSTSEEVHGGWDHGRQATVFIDERANETWSWDGKTWKELPHCDVSQPRWLVNLPKGDLAALGGFGRNGLRLSVLGKKAWKGSKAKLPDMVDGVLSAAKGQPLLFFGVHGGQSTRALGFFDGEKTTVSGAPQTECWELACDGVGNLLASSRRNRSPNEDPDEETPILTRIRDTGPELVGEGPLRTLWVGLPEGFMGLGPRGVWRLGPADGAPTRAGSVPKAFKGLGVFCAAWDADRDVLMAVCGDGGRKIGLWEGAPKAFAPAKTKGRTPGFYSAECCYVPGRGLLVVGWTRKGMVTAHLEGGKWESYATECKFPGSAKAVVHDPSSNRTLLVTWPNRGHATTFAYCGFGKWIPTGAVEPRQDGHGHGAGPCAGLTLDPTSSRLVAYGQADHLGGGHGLYELPLTALDLSGVEDAASPPPASAPSAPAAPSAPSRFLWFRDLGNNKFWFAELKGSSYTLRWGRRGRKATSKTFSKKNAAAARAEFEKKVNKKLDEGYQDSPWGEQAAELRGKPAFWAYTYPRGTDYLSGDPPSLGSAGWPRCAECGQHQLFIALLHAHPDRLPLQKHAALALFICEGEEGCSTWSPDSGCNAAFLVKAKALERPLPSPEGAPSLGPYEFLAYKERFDPDPAHEPFMELEQLSKLGGYPVWVQSPEVPQCSTCNEPHEFVAQLADDLHEGLIFGDSGRAYVFVCPKEHEAKLLWQCF